MAEPIKRFRWFYVAIAALFVVLALVRVVLSYPHTAQTFDEPYHVGAAVELWSKGTYTQDPLHPPLQRIAIGLPLFLAGVRYPAAEEISPKDPLACAVGNAALNSGGHYARNLMLARLGVLPFLLLSCAVVFLWARREYGNVAAVAAVALYTTLPIVLAFSSIAYTDMVAAATQLTAFWAFTNWLQKQSMRSAVLMGMAVGLALLGKTTTYLFFPAAVFGIVALRWAVIRTNKGEPQQISNFWLRQASAAAIVAIVVLWGGYGFKLQHFREGMNLSGSPMPSFQHFPAPLRGAARGLVVADPVVPAPALLRGLADIWLMEQSRPDSYLLGHLKPGGWWYFFLVGIAVKSPIPFLILVFASLIFFYRFLKEGCWTPMAPAACVVAILMVTMPVKINYGVRHVLLLFPLLAVVAGYGCSRLWNSNLLHRRAAISILVVLLAWQAVSSADASSDYIAYFNRFAGHDPSQVMVAGCDLDCGQDLLLLSRELRERHVSQMALALWTSADLSKAGLPEFTIAQPYQPVRGWFAISLRALHAGDLFHTTYPQDSFAWVQTYRPVVRVGKTILLYNIAPEKTLSSESR
ncbi:MAG: glycosyltransferase family 39 protein [Candidatus Sulfotelmatobacter sp.]